MEKSKLYFFRRAPLGKKRPNQNKPCRLVCHTFSPLWGWGRVERRIYFKISGGFFSLRFQKIIIY